MKTSLLATAILASLATAQVDLAPAIIDKPIVLDSKNFYGTVLDLETQTLIGDKAWFIEFYAPWCPHCQHLEPIWDTLYLETKETLKVARVDCTSAEGRPMCKHFEVKGYPTILYFPVGQRTYHKYHGHRQLEDFKRWISEEGWKDEEAKDVESNKSTIEEYYPTTNAILTALHDTFLG